MRWDENLILDIFKFIQYIKENLIRNDNTDKEDDY